MKCNLRQSHVSTAHAKRAVNVIALVTAIATLSACGQMLPGTGQGWRTPLDEGFTYLREALMWQFFDELRPSKQTLAWMSRTNPNGGPYRDNRGTIPMAMVRPEVDEVELCTLRGDVNCGSIAFGEDIIGRPELRRNIEDWLVNFCDRFPKEVSNEQLPQYFLGNDRAGHATYLRKFMGCEAGKRPLTIHLYAIRDFDQVFNGLGTTLDATLKQSVVGDWVIKLNQ